MRNRQPHRAVYRDRRWRPARQECLRRDGYRCRHLDENGQRCAHTDPTGRTLHAHHHPLSARELLARGLDPFGPERLVTLCRWHHAQLRPADR